MIVRIRLNRMSAAELNSYTRVKRARKWKIWKITG